MHLCRCRNEDAHSAFTLAGPSTNIFKAYTPNIIHNNIPVYLYDKKKTEYT